MMAIRPVPIWILAILVAGGSVLHAQTPIPLALEPSPLTAPAIPSRPAKHSKAPAETPPQPSFSIPVAPLGFSPPSTQYLGDRWTQASLSFLNEDTLLFTFRVPGLIVRDPAVASTSGERQRHVRAVVLSLPSGQVQAEALWTIHDAAPYLWPMRNGQFLLRDRDTLALGDSALHLSGLLQFPGPILTLTLDPTQRFLATQSLESGSEPKPAATAGLSSQAGSQPDSNTSGTSHAADAEKSADQPSQALLRIFNLEDHKLLLYSRIPGQVDLPIDAAGEYQFLTGKADDAWLLVYQPFEGPTEVLLSINSACQPFLQVMAPGVVLSSGCSLSGERTVAAVSRFAVAGNAKATPPDPASAKEDNSDKRDKGRKSDPVKATDKDKSKLPLAETAPHLLWQVSFPATSIWPLLSAAFDGPRIARETLQVRRPIGPLDPLDTDDIRGQKVTVYNLADGSPAITVAAAPVLDGGGNFALSPSGNRFAILSAGAIQVYQLPPAPALPAPASSPHP